MTEDVFGSRITLLAEQLGFLHHHDLHYHATMPGFPDYFLVHREAGTHWIFECKVKGRNLTRLQHTWIQALKDAGFNASVVTEDDWWTGKLHQRLVELASPMTAPVVPLLKAA